MKTLILLAHPDIQGSRINKALKTAALEGGAEVNELYEKYPNFDIAVKKEQKLLAEHHRIILQFPCFWYSCPSLLKKYIDDVFEYGFAYGSSGTALKGKEFALAVSFGAKENELCTDTVCRKIDEIFLPFECSVSFVNAKLLSPFFIFDTQNVSDKELAEKAALYKRFIKA